MPIIEVDWNPPGKNLRVFSVACLVFCVALAAYLHLGHGKSLSTAGIIAGIGLLVAVVGLLIPPLVRPLYVVLMVVALPVGLIVSTVLLLVVYYLVLTPIGLLTRLFGHDPMGKRFDPAATSYWSKRKTVKESGTYFKQY